MLFKEFLSQSKDNYIAINDSEQYVVAGLQNYGQGMIGKREVFGRELTMKKYQVLKENQLMWCKVDTKNGAFSITTKEHVGMIASTNMFVVDIDTQKCVPYLLQLLFSMPFFYNNINEKSLGTTNRKYLKPQEVLSTLEFPALSIEQQYKLMEKIKRLSNETKVIQVKISQNEKFISSLRQAILQQAVEGKLCEQDQTDEPASVLLEKIKAEKEKLIAEKKIKKQKDLPPITEEEKPFDLPKGWEWCRLGEICEINPRNNELDEKECSFIPMCLISDGYSNHHDHEIKKWKTIKSGFTHFKNGDIGLAKITPCFENKKSVIFNNLCNGFGAGTTELHVLRTSQQFTAKYILNMIKSNDFIQSGVKTYTGTAGQQRIGKSFIEMYIAPLPPLAEQQRIVEKVDKLMSLCDELEQEVTSAKKYASQLMEAVLQEAFNNNQAETKDDVIIFVPQPQRVNTHKQILAAAARGKMSEATWKRIAYEAVKLASEEN